jgi:hypothetical protein
MTRRVLALCLVAGLALAACADTNNASPNPSSTRTKNAAIAAASSTTSAAPPSTAAGNCVISVQRTAGNSSFSGAFRVTACQPMTAINVAYWNNTSQATQTMVERYPAGASTVDFQNLGQTPQLITAAPNVIAVQPVFVGGFKPAWLQFRISNAVQSASVAAPPAPPTTTAAPPATTLGSATSAAKQSRSSCAVQVVAFSVSTSCARTATYTYQWWNSTGAISTTYGVSRGNYTFDLISLLSWKPPVGTTSALLNIRLNNGRVISNLKVTFSYSQVTIQAPY